MAMCSFGFFFLVVLLYKNMVFHILFYPLSFMNGLGCDCLSSFCVNLLKKS